MSEDITQPTEDFPIVEPTLDPQPTPVAEGGNPPEPTEPSSQPTEPQEPVEPPTPEPTAAPQPVTPQVDPTALAQQIVAAQQAAQAQAEANQPLTQEQIDSILRTVRVSENQVEQLFNPDTPIADKTSALQSLLLSAVENAVARNQVLTQDAMSRFYKTEFTPIAQQIAYQQAQKARVDFYNEYPGLEPYAEAVAMVANGVKDVPEFRKSNASQARKYIADKVTSLLKKTLPDFDPKVKSSVPNASGSPSAVPRATQASFQSGTKVVTNPSSGQYPSSGSVGGDIFGDEGLV